MLGYYWRAREWMGTENLSYAWYDEPAMIEDMMEFITDFTIETSRPVFAAGVKPDYVFINEDLSMKNGPLLSPDMYRRFILPQMKRLVSFLKSSGVRWVIVDTDGNCELVIPHFLEAGVDAIWPMERASDMDPLALRRGSDTTCASGAGWTNGCSRRIRPPSMRTGRNCGRWWRRAGSSRRWITSSRRTSRGRTSSTTCGANGRSCGARDSESRGPPPPARDRGAPLTPARGRRYCRGPVWTPCSTNRSSC
jgi:hypothetical protein